MSFTSGVRIAGGMYGTDYGTNVPSMRGDISAEGQFVSIVDASKLLSVIAPVTITGMELRQMKMILATAVVAAITLPSAQDFITSWAIPKDGIMISIPLIVTNVLSTITLVAGVGCTIEPSVVIPALAVSKQMLHILVTDANVGGLSTYAYHVY